MTSSLVGSEMCIRDRLSIQRVADDGGDAGGGAELVPCGGLPAHVACTVSYTHLTLPTICSV
eukprot:9400349-Prorocentrum_lima.AAC.1